MTSFRFSSQSLKTLLLVTGVCLLLVIPAQAGQPPDFQTGKSLFEHGDFNGAFSIFQQLVQQNPGDPELDFLLGRSAFEIGDYETAIFAFERVLIARPEADRVRLELGRSYFELGEFESARTSFREVLEHNPPINVRTNIERYLQLIDKASRQHQFSGMLSLGLSYDDNAYTSPIDDRIKTILDIINLTGNNATPQEDFISQSTLALSHLYRKHPRRPGWLTGLLFYNASYFDNQDLNLNLLGLSTGPIWSLGTWQGRVQGSFNYLTLDNDRYLTTAGLDLEETWRPNATYSLGLLGALTRLNYASDNRDADQYRLLARPAGTWGKNRLSADLGGEWSEARDDQYSYFRYLFRIGYERRLPWQVAMNLGYRLQDTIYTGLAPLFGKKRQDIMRESSLVLSRVFWTRPKGEQLRALLSYVYTYTTSNIDLYKYDKQVLSFALSYLF